VQSATTSILTLRDGCQRLINNAPRKVLKRVHHPFDVMLVLAAEGLVNPRTTCMPWRTVFK
jgi:hypothetical protein